MGLYDKIKKRRVYAMRVRAALCLFFLFLCSVLSSCQREAQNAGTEYTVAEKGVLSVWFFACSEDADSILLQTQDRNVVIDTGLECDSDRLIRKLEGLQVDNIDLLILTHPDKDHIGGADKLLEKFPVEQVIQTSYEKGSVQQEELDDKLEERLQEEKILTVQEKTEFTFGDLQLTVYPPGKQYDNANNNSIAVLAQFEGKKFFFAGDAKKKRIEELLEEGLPKVDVYKVAYHGRDSDNSRVLVEVLQPQIAVVTAREAEKKTAQVLADVGADVYSIYKTDVHFTVSDGILDAG